MTKLLSTMDPSGQSVYYSRKFRLMIEDHMLILRSMPTNRLFQLAQDQKGLLYRYVGDFSGFLRELGYDAKYHWVIMRINGYSSRLDLDEFLTSLILPDWDYIDKLAQLCKEKRA